MKRRYTPKPPKPPKPEKIVTEEMRQRKKEIMLAAWRKGMEARKIKMLNNLKCPDCGSLCKKAGVDAGRQRYLCKECRRSFNEQSQHKAKPPKVEMVCYRCGNMGKLLSIGRASMDGKKVTSGLRGHCTVCNKDFTQGGRTHLMQNYGALALAVVGHMPELAAEMQQIATELVLSGRCYVWNISWSEVRARAWKAIRGAYKDYGSADYAYQKLVNGVVKNETL